MNSTQAPKTIRTGKEVISLHDLLEHLKYSGANRVPFSLFFDVISEARYCFICGHHVSDHLGWACPTTAHLKWPDYVDLWDGQPA